MKKLTIDAKVDNLPEVSSLVEESLEEAGASPKVIMQIALAVEEIFVNIANYAYSPGTGQATVEVDVTEDPLAVTIVFMDSGVPYDPLDKEDPDITLSAEDRQIGGLGIYMTKKIMDEVIYENSDGKNILTLKKTL